MNKIGCLEASNEWLILLTKSYRKNALDTFIRGLDGDLLQLFGMREPMDSPQTNTPVLPSIGLYAADKPTTIAI